MENMAEAGIHPKSVFITGANRGIGLEFVKQFLALPTPPEHLFATFRNESSSQELLELAASHSNLHTVKYEVTDYDALNDVVRLVESYTENLNMLINNAGIMTSRSDGPELNIEDSTAKEMMFLYENNAVAPLMIIQAFLTMLKKASAGPGMSASEAAIINISSCMGSCGDNTTGGQYGYRTSRAAMNMITRSCSIDLKTAGILVAALHPGWVKTNLGGPGALITTSESVEGLMKVMAGLKEDGTGGFYSFKGEDIPW